MCQRLGPDAWLWHLELCSVTEQDLNPVVSERDWEEPE
jgi:hypothetical protein